MWWERGEGRRVKRGEVRWGEVRWGNVNNIVLAGRLGGSKALQTEQSISSRPDSHLRLSSAGSVQPVLSPAPSHPALHFSISFIFLSLFNSYFSSVECNVSSYYYYYIVGSSIVLGGLGALLDLRSGGDQWWWQRLAGPWQRATVVTRASGETTPRPGTAPSQHSDITATPGRQTPGSRQPARLPSVSDNDNDNKSQLRTLYLSCKLN